MRPSRHILKIALTAVAMLTVGAASSSAQKLDRGLSISSMPVFAQKGSWMVGGTANWSFHNNENFQFAIADGINSTGYNVNVSPAVCYMFGDNVGVGIRFGYERSNLKVDSANIGVGDLGIGVEDIHSLNHSYKAQAILRNYIPLGNSAKLALFNEVQIEYMFGTKKMVDGNGDGYDGSFGTFRNIGLNLCPGIVAFANDHLAIDVNVNMLGLGFGNTDQSHNQTAGASRNYTVMNFKINILAIGFGLYYYL